MMLKKSVGGWFKDAWKKTADIGKSIVDKGKKALNATVDAAKSVGKTILGKGKAVLTGVADTVKGAGTWVGKIPGIKGLGKFLGGTAKVFAKVAVPLEAARGTMAGFASRGEDDDRT